MVMPAVEMPLEAQDGALADEGAGEADAHQRRLGAGRGEANALGRGDKPLDRLGPADFARMRGAELRAVRGRGSNRGGDFRVAVTEDERTVAAEVIDISVAIDIPFMRPLGARDVDAVGIDVAGVMGDARRHQILRLGREIGRAGRLLAVGGDDTRVDTRIFEGGCAGH